MGHWDIRWKVRLGPINGGLRSLARLRDSAPRPSELRQMTQLPQRYTMSTFHLSAR